jgi:acyl-coenzyme A synthetase/AMP-(fatty) acid ligase
MISVEALPRNPNGKLLKEALRVLANAPEPADR